MKTVRFFNAKELRLLINEFKKKLGLFYSMLLTAESSPYIESLEREIDKSEKQLKKLKSRKSKKQYQGYIYE